MQHTIRNIPKVIDAALRRRAKRERKTLNQVAVDALAEGLGLTLPSQTRRSLGDVVGTVPRAKGENLDAEIAAQRTIDPDLWR